MRMKASTAAVTVIVLGLTGILYGQTPVVHLTLDSTATNSGSGGATYDATLVNGPGYVDGVVGSHGLDLAKASDQYVSVPYTLPDQGTIALWYYVRSYYNYNSVFDNSVQQDDWEMWVYGDARLRFRIGGTGGDVTFDDLNSIGGVGKWYHFVTTWDKNGSVELYVNGSSKGSSAVTGWINPGATFYVGGGNAGNTAGDGVVDDLRIYNTELDSGQVWSLFASQVSGLQEPIAARVDVDPRSGAPTATILNQTAGADLWVGSGNEGDFALGYPGAGIPILQANGVVIANCNELPTSGRGSVAAAGELTGIPPGNSDNGGVWIASFTSAGGGEEDNYDFSAAWFPYSSGTIGGHINAAGDGFLGSGNLPAGSTVSVASGPDYGGELLLTLNGVDPRTDGMLFVVDGRNDDNTASAAVPDQDTIEGGSSWHIAAFDESGGFDNYEQGQVSFLYVPYSTEGLCGGWVGHDGTKKDSRGTFRVTRAATGKYEIVIPDEEDVRYDDTDGILLVTVARLYELGEPGTTSAGVDDNAIAWAYDPAADGGDGAFVVETYDLAGWNDQDTEFVFAFVLYDGLFNVPGPPHGTLFVIR
jgi:hypothetical protein